MTRVTIKPSDITIIVDTREQTPFAFEEWGFNTEVGTLKTGDYTVKGLESQVVVERKSLADLLGCIGKGRQRFERELTRMKEFKSRAVVVSASEKEIEAGNYHYSRLTPKQVIGSYTGWMAWNIPFIFAEDHEKAAKRAAHFLWINAKRHLRINKLGEVTTKET